MTPNKRLVAKKSPDSNTAISAIKLILLVALAAGLLFLNNDLNKVKDHNGSPAKKYQEAKSDTDYGRENDNSIDGGPAKPGLRTTLNEELLAASIYGDAERVKALLNQPVDINTVDDSGDTPLIIATTHNHKEIVSLLLKREADVNASNRVGNSALIEAAAIGNDEIVRSLLAGGADVKIKNIAGQTALETAQQYGHRTIVQLLSGKANALPKPGLIAPNAGAAYPKYLHEAANQGDVEGVSSLINSGVNVNARDGLGRTALILATRKGHIQIVRLLLKSGADPNVKDNFGETAISNAQRLGLIQIGQLLKQAGAKTPLYNQIVTDPKQQTVNH